MRRRETAAAQSPLYNAAMTQPAFPTGSTTLLLDGPAGALEVADGAARAERDVDGVTEVLEADLPVVVSVNDHINRPRFPNFKLIMAARTKAITTWSLAELDVDTSKVGAAGARTQVLSAEPRPERPPVELHVDSGQGGIALADFLARRGLV